MPKLGEPNFDWTAPCCETEYRRWTRQASFNFSGNQNKNKESQVSFLQTWLCKEGIKEPGYYDWAETDRANSDKIFIKIKEIIQPAYNTEIYRNQFYKLKQNMTQTLLDFYFEILHIYELCKFEDEGRCTEHKNCADSKKAIKDAQLKGIICIASEMTNYGKN